MGDLLHYCWLEEADRREKEEEEDEESNEEMRSDVTADICWQRHKEELEEKFKAVNVDQVSTMLHPLRRHHPMAGPKTPRRS